MNKLLIKPYESVNRFRFQLSLKAALKNRQIYRTGFVKSNLMKAFSIAKKTHDLSKNFEFAIYAGSASMHYGRMESQSLEEREKLLHGGITLLEYHEREFNQLPIETLDNSLLEVYQAVLYTLSNLWVQGAKNNKKSDYTKAAFMCKQASIYYEKFIDIVLEQNVYWLPDSVTSIFEEFVRCKILHANSLFFMNNYKEALKILDSAENMLIAVSSPDMSDEVEIETLREMIEEEIEAEEEDEDNED